MARTTRPSVDTDTLDGVLVAGGGYAGLHAARAAQQSGAHTTIVDPSGRHDFVTRLAAVAGGASPVRDASCDLAEFGHDVIVGEVAGVVDGIVTLDGGRRIEAEAVVVTSGARPSQPDIPGIELTMPLRTADDALAIRSRLEDAPAVIIIGGGATGVQLAGAIAHVHGDMSVRLVESDDRLLAALDSDVGAGAARILRDRRVMADLGAAVDEITSDGAVVDGEHHDGIVIWAGGFDPCADGLGVTLDEDGRIVVDEYLRIAGMERTFAAGDVAAHRDDNGDPLAMSAQIAVQAGSAAGENAARLLHGKELQSASLVQRGWVIDLSGQRGLAQFGPLILADPFADLIPPLLHEAIDIKTRFGIGGISALDL